jgi:membrane-associated PAP2 superfamily phosphatase
MNRTGLLIALAVAAVVGLVFAIDPKLDLAIAAPWFDPQHLGFWARIDPRFLFLRDFNTYAVTAIVAPAVLAVAWKLIQPRRRMPIPGRAALLMIATLALGPGLVTNVILKDTWGRPRPIDVTEFEGESHFVPWWDPRGDCDKNCSFVAGEPSGAFWTLAPAALAPPQWRALAYAGALAFGAVIGFGRIAAGGHFFSDVVFSGVFTFLVIWIAHGLIYRWRATRTADEQVEGAIERFALPGYTALERLLARLRGKPNSL